MFTKFEVFIQNSNLAKNLNWYLYVYLKKMCKFRICISVFVIRI